MQSGNVRLGLLQNARSQNSRALSRCTHIAQPPRRLISATIRLRWLRSTHVSGFVMNVMRLRPLLALYPRAAELHCLICGKSSSDKSIEFCLRFCGGHCKKLCSKHESLFRSIDRFGQHHHLFVRFIHVSSHLMSFIGMSPDICAAPRARGSRHSSPGRIQPSRRGRPLRIPGLGIGDASCAHLGE